MKLPAAVGVPLIVITLVDQDAVTPAGKPVAVPMPVAIVVDIVIFLSGVFTCRDGFDDGVPDELSVLSVQGVTVVVVVVMGEPPAAFFATTENK